MSLNNAYHDIITFIFNEPLSDCKLETVSHHFCGESNVSTADGREGYRKTPKLEHLIHAFGDDHIDEIFLHENRKKLINTGLIYIY